MLTETTTADPHMDIRTRIVHRRKEINFPNLRTSDIGLVSVVPKSVDRTSRWYSLVWIDKAGLGLAAVVLAAFLIVWLMLILAAGSAPTGRLSTLCLEWMTKAISEVVVPIWLIARGIRAMVPKVVQVFGSHKPPAWEI